MRGIASAATASSTTTTTATTMSVPSNECDEPLAGRSRLASPERVTARMSSTCTKNPHTLSIAPTATAPVAERPTRWKNRISSAILAAELGTARPMNWMPYWSRITGPRRTGRTQAPTVANPWATPTTGDISNAKRSR